MSNRSSVDQLRGSRVMVVDDEPTVCNLVCRWLTDAGYTCMQAHRTATAWDMLRQHEVDLMTLDVTMPETSGIELLPRIRADFPDLPVIMLTAQAETRAAINALTLGASAYLLKLKPVERQELLFHVQSGLERRQLVLQNRQYTRHLEDLVRRQTAVIRAAHEETICRLVTASAYRDEETGAHIRRTGLYSELMAEVLGWPAPDIENLRMAAPMHDVGKIGVPDAILQKPGKLTPQEYEIMKTHAEIGARMLSGSASPMLQMAEQIAWCHHERWDGSGYPRQLRAEQIPECARIVAIVDVFDALTHDRVYRPAMSLDQTLAILEQGRGTHFDPFLLGVFSGIYGQMQRIAQENPDSPREPSPERLTASDYAAPAKARHLAVLATLEGFHHEPSAL